MLVARSLCLSASCIQTQRPVSHADNARTLTVTRPGMLRHSRGWMENETEWKWKVNACRGTTRIPPPRAERLTRADNCEIWSRVSTAACEGWTARSCDRPHERPYSRVEKIPGIRSGFRMRDANGKTDTRRGVPQAVYTTQWPTQHDVLITWIKPKIRSNRNVWRGGVWWHNLQHVCFTIQWIIFMGNGIQNYLKLKQKCFLLQSRQENSIHFKLNFV